MITPFDGRKVAYHLPYWSPIASGKIPPPVLVTLDPINRCNLKCSWCNAAAQMACSSEQYTPETIAELPGFLSGWGVKAVCIAGGGEPLGHRLCSDLISGLADAGIEVGVVTNGTLISRHVAALGRCKWVGVSVDAGTRSTFKAQKGADLFEAVTAGIRQLRDAHPDLEITYKYLLHPSNIKDLSSAVPLAKNLRCNYFHARPAGRTWAEVQQGERGSLFTPAEIDETTKALRSLKSYYDGDGFTVQAITNKVSSAWGIEHRFSRCWALGMTCVISPDGTCGLCCDRRGDDKTKLCDWKRLTDIHLAWGKARHLDVLADCDLSDCPRCTYSPHNELFEGFCIYDKACKWFI